MIFDPLYLMILLAGLVLGGMAQLAVKSAFSKYSKVAASSGLTGAQAARQMLMHAGLGADVGIERVGGFLSDHYDPRSRVLRLSPDVHDGRSLAALGVACHEAGHAIQHARKYSPLVIRNTIVPVAGFGSNFSFILIIIGIVLGAAQGAGLGTAIATLGILLFATVVVFQLINLPVEFDASHRAKVQLREMGLIRAGAEEAGVAKVLNAAAMTYVAATAVALMQLLYWVFVIFGNRR